MAANSSSRYGHEKKHSNMRSRSHYLSTGGLVTMRPDIEIPKKYGIFQPSRYGRSRRWSRTLRNVPVFAKWRKSFSVFVRMHLSSTIPTRGGPDRRIPCRRAGFEGDRICHGPVGLCIICQLFGGTSIVFQRKSGGINHFSGSSFTVDGKTAMNP